MSEATLKDFDDQLRQHIQAARESQQRQQEEHHGRRRRKQSGINCENGESMS